MSEREVVDRPHATHVVFLWQQTCVEYNHHGRHHRDH